MATRSLFRRVVGAGFLAGIGYALWRAVEANRSGTGSRWEPQPFPFPPQPRADAPASEAAAEAAATPWVEPRDGACPASHPVKAKLASGIFHEAGGANYERTRADRCYADAAAAEADGLRPAKR